VSLADNNANKQHCYARNNSHVDVSMVTGLVVFEHLLISPVCVGIRSRADVCVFGYGLLLVGRLSSYREIVREAREFIPWTVKTFDRRGWKMAG
jgi:hypothetical protein